MQVGRWGQLQEWMEDWDNPQDHHRHVSHLWGLYPGRQISAYHSPVLFEAAKDITDRPRRPLYRLVYGMESLFFGQDVWMGIMHLS